MPSTTPSTSPTAPKRSSRAGWLVVPAVLLFALVASGSISLEDRSEPEVCGLACEGGPAGLVIGLGLVALIPIALVALVVLVVSRGTAVSNREETGRGPEANDRGPTGR